MREVATCIDCVNFGKNKDRKESCEICALTGHWQTQNDSCYLFSFKEIEVGYTKTWYCWKELDRENNRLLTPWSNRFKHEHPFDHVYTNPEIAKEALKFDGDPDAGWLLCKMTLEVVEG